MKTSLRKFVQSGFTLVELLIVVIILAILAAVVIPQFANSTVEARESALDANLSAMRAAIELYRAQHNVYPGAVTAAGGVCATPGTGIATGGTGVTASQALVDQLTQFSNTAGQSCTTNAALAFRWGPYLRRGMPNDPFTNTGSLVANIRTVAAGTPLAPGAVGNGGWAYDTVTGQIIMDSSTVDSRGNTYGSH